MAEPATNLEPSSFLLSDFLKYIKKTIDGKFKDEFFWVKGELSDWQHKTHYYGELVEYAGENSKQTTAKIRINMWSSIAGSVIPKFNNSTGDKPKVGMKVLLLVQVQYHANFGLSLSIFDIDPSFTLGDREARKKAIIQQLIAESIINKNKQLPSPRDFTNVAIISAEGAAGLGDFFVEAKKLENAKLCKFKLYPAVMQGKDCAKSVTTQFRAIYSEIKDNDSHYDVIILIRGGGSQADLDAFNHISISKAICHMQIPVFVGIGHERDETVLDQLAQHKFDTPSKIIGHIQNTIIGNAIRANDVFINIQQIAKSINTQKDTETKNIYKQIALLSQQILKLSGSDIETKNNIIKKQALSKIELQNQSLENIYDKIKSSATSLSQSQADKLEAMYKHILSMSIMPTLERGFALVKNNDKYITTAKQAESFKKLNIQFADGEIEMEKKTNG